VGVGRHRGRGRAKRPLSEYQSLDRSRRRKIVKALILGRTIDPADEPFARARASHAAAQLPQALGRGSFFGSLLALYWESLLPLTAATTTIVVCAVVALVIFLLGLSFAIRMRLWLRRNPVGS
jgi:hypothetical protein